jgi:plasmid stabilization system protein ParE
VKLVIVPLAIAELQDAADFYTDRANRDLGLAFLAEFERAATIVLENPMLGAVFRGSSRRYLLRRFPYSIIYQVTTEELRVVAVAHHRRRPGYWINRHPS